ncbi:DUF4129 domain-containing transglutaminase family protein [Peribacillus sp. SCS-37]|uniref:DUF4129 domain-containing transglutaminase family protein n=1 Tax=Paraperibacillus esterisolvens TaxID=3115296 RepID=UPI0039066D13
MNAASERMKRHKAGNLVLHVLGFLLLWECLRPLGALTDTGSLTVFVAFAGLSMLLKYLDFSRWLRYSMTGAYILVVIHHFYYKEIVLISLSWIVEFMGSLFRNAGLLLNRDWYSISNDFKTLLFFLLLYIMGYLIIYWLVVRKSILLFFLVSVFYMAVLDTFTPYDADSAIVRLIVFGFATLGIQTYYRLVEKDRLVSGRAAASKWMVPLLVLISCSALLGFAGPKNEPLWPDPVPFIKTYSEKVSGDGGGGSRVGYGENDDKLGGPFEGDDDVVFLAKASSRHYWKVESKNFYTGKGWEVANIAEDAVLRLPENEKLYFFAIPTNKKTSFNATLTINKKYSHVPYPEPLGLTKIKAPKAAYFDFDANKEKVVSYGANEASIQLDKVSLEYEVPRFEVEEMRKIDGSGNGETDSQLNATDFSIYTQLPSTVPERVRALAAEIVKGKQNRFDQVKAIEDYFDREEFVYDQKNVPYPEENQDYTDQFLFETKVGYCDNYSTSMVVLLRSLGIPSRWVKGYSDGDFIKSEDSQSIYEITNNNAHSWVEVYFPNSGWVPFEPTKGFTNSTRFEFPNDARNSTQTAAPATQPEKPKAEKTEQDKVKKTAPSTGSGLLTRMREAFAANKFILFAGLLVIAGMILLCLKMRGRWMPKLWLAIYKNKREEEDFTKSYPLLLKELNRFGLKRPEGQTLREYAKYVDSFFQSMDMTRLTSVYEHMVYKGTVRDADWPEVHRMWERLMKKTIA